MATLPRVPITVAIIEDDARTRAHMESFLNARAELRLVASCANAEDALTRLPALAPELVVCDIQLPGVSGIECVRRLRPQLPQTQFMMLTIVEDYDAVFDAILAGATGYLLKGDGLDRLPDTVLELHAGGSPMTPSIARRVIDAFQQRAARDALEAQLTERERQVLDLLARGRIYKEIAAELGVSTDTIRAHLNRIYKKLHVRNRAEAARRWRFPFGWVKK